MKLFDQIEGFASSFFSTISALFSIIKLEARLAGLSVYPLLLNLCMLFIVLMTIWLSSMVLMVYYLIIVSGSLVMAIGMMTLLNIGLFLLLLKYMQFNLRNMSFVKSRAYFSKKGTDEHEQLEKTNNR